MDEEDEMVYRGTRLTDGRGTDILAHMDVEDITIRRGQDNADGKKTFTVTIECLGTS